MLELLTTVFRQLLSMALTALPVMAAVLLVRALLGKAPRKYAYALWLVVAFRLVCPVTLPESALSLFNLNALAPVTEHTVDVGAGFSAVTPLPAPPPAGGMMSQPMPDLAGPPAAGGSIITPIGGPTPVEIALTAAALIWLVGLVALAFWGLRSYARLRRQVATAVRREDGIWECDGIPTPFVLGLFRPNIYIPFRLSDNQRTYVLLHERHHIKRRDHWTKPLALAILAVYWWDPAVWLCWVLYCRDMEMSCDEAVLSRLGQEVKADYSRSLVSFALDRRMPTALAFGEHDAARRVKNVLDWQRAKPRVTFLALAAVLVTLVVCSTGAKTGGTWLRREKPDIFDIPCYSYSVPDAESFVIYREVYEYGALTDRSFMVCGDIGGSTPRKGEFSIRMEQNWDSSTVLDWGLGQMKTGERQVSNGHIYVDQTLLGEGTWTFVPTYETQWTLPEQFVGGGMGRSSLLAGEMGRKISLKPTSDTVLAAYYPYGEGQAISAAPSCTELNDGDPAALLADTPYAIVIRLRLGAYASNLCQESVEWGSSDLAAKLWALRADEVTEEAVAEVLALLGDTTPFTLEEGYFFDPDALLVNFETEPAFGEAACNLTALLPALFADVESVVYGYPGSGGGNNYHELYSPDSKNMNLTHLAQELGYADIKDLGQYRDGIRALVDSLFIPQGLIRAATPKEPPQPPTADELARRLFNWRTDHVTDTVRIETILNTLGVPAAHEISTYPSNEGWVLKVWFPDDTLDPAEIQQTMWPAAQVLLALVGDAARVDYGWPTRFGSSTESIPPEDGLARKLGYDDMKDLGRTSQGIRALLNFLDVGYEETPNAPADLPTRLHTLRTGSMKNQADVRAILSALGADGLGSFTVKAYSGGELRVDFTDRPADAIPESPVVDNAMWTYAHFLLALVEDAETVSWFYPSNGSGMGHAFERSEADARAKALGYRDIKDLGLTTEGIQALADYLHMDQSHGRTLYDMRLTTANDVQGVRAILRYLGVGGEYTLSWPNQGTLTLTFPEEPPELETFLPPVTYLLMALVDDLEQVEWTYAVENGHGNDSWTVRPSRSGADAYARKLGYDDIKTLGQSVEGIQRVLDLWNGTISLGTATVADTAASADAAELLELGAFDPAELAGHLLIEGYWDLGGEVRPAGWGMGEDGVVEIEIWEQPADPDTLDRAMWKNAMVLLAACPDVTSVEWSYPDEITADLLSQSVPQVSRKIDVVQGDEKGIAVRFTEPWADWVLRSAEETAVKGKSIRSFGTSPAALGTLLSWLDGQVTEEERWEAYLNDVANNGFLASAYSRPEEIDLGAVFHDGAGLPNIARITSEERAACVSASGVDYYLDVTKITAAQADAFLREKCGVSLGENRTGFPKAYTYLPDYDAYYCPYRGSAMKTVRVHSVAPLTDGAAVTYTRDGRRMTVTMRQAGEAWQFVSNLDAPTD